MEHDLFSTENKTNYILETKKQLEATKLQINASNS